MKHQKSSYSLYGKTQMPFSEINQNQSSNINWKSLFKRQNNNPKDFSSLYNARGRLNSCRQQLIQLQHQIQSSNLTNKDMHLEITFIKQQYNLRKFTELEQALSNMTKQLKKKVTIGKRSDLLKYQSIQQILGSISKNHKQLKGKIQQIDQRVTNMENIMGCPPIPFEFTN